MKKLLAFVLSLTMLLSICAFSSAESDTTGKPFMKYDEPITLTVMCSYGASDGDVADVTEGIWPRAYKELFNIDLDFTFVATSDEYNTRVNLQLASGDIPDLLMVNLTQLYQMIDADLVQPLDELYDNGWFWQPFYDAMTADGTFPLDISSRDGHRYAIPAVQPVTEAVHAMFINNDWLEATGNAVPTTLEELEKVVYDFTKNDPDGNGADDTYGFGLSKKLWDLGYEAMALANAYPDYWIKDENGKVVYGSVQENMKPVLEKLAQWYKDGCIDPEFIVKEYSDEGDLVPVNKVGLGFGVQWLWLQGGGLRSQYTNMTVEERDATKGWNAWPLPSVDGTAVTKPAAKDRTDGFLVVSKNCKHPEAAAIIANFIHFCGIGPQGVDPTTDGSRPDLALEYGDKVERPDEISWDTLWDKWSLNLYSPETLHNNLGRWEHWYAALKQYQATGEIDTELTDWIYNNYLARNELQRLLDFSANGQYMEGMTAASGNAYTWDDVIYEYGYHCSGETFVYAMDCRDSGNIVYDELGAYVTETMQEVWSQLQDKELQVFTQIIIGDADISAFDTFVAEWKANGGDMITAEVNEFVAGLE